MTLPDFYVKIVSYETILKSGEFMAMFMRKLNFIARCAGEYRTQQSSVQLPGIYHSYFFAICRTPGMSQDRIGAHLGMNKSSVTRHLAYLEQNGYVERKPSTEDKRQILVYPTEKMLVNQAEVVQIAKQWNQQLCESIPEEEMQAFLEVLDKIYAKAKEISKEGGETK